MAVRWLLLAVLFAVLVAFLVLNGFSASSGCEGDVVGFVAPTLVKVISDGVAKSGLSARGLLSIGAVEGLRRMQQGVVPDLYGSVDVELLKEVERLGPRQVFVLGRFGMGLVCRTPLSSPEELVFSKVAVADPNKAPIGYRALAAAWLMKKEGFVDLVSRFERLEVRYVETERGVNITVPAVLSPSGDVQVASSLDAAWSMLEVGAVDCTFVHTPFVLGRFDRLEEVGRSSVWTVYRGVHGRLTYYVYFFNGVLSFLDDPPYEIYVILGQQAVRVVRFEAFVASFSERGDCVIEALREMDLSSYGFLR